MSTSGRHVNNRHLQDRATRQTHSSGGWDPSIGGLSAGESRDGEQLQSLDVAPRAVNTGHFDPVAEAPRVRNRPLTADANVWIDETGLHVDDGAIFLNDYTGSSVLEASGFAGSWVEFIASGVYNSSFSAGSTSALAVSKVGTGTGADYGPSLSIDLPYWVIDSITGSVTLQRVIDSSKPAGHYLRFLGNGSGGTATIYQDAPVSPLTYGYGTVWSWAKPAVSGPVDVSVQQQYTNASHVLIGSLHSTAYVVATAGEEKLFPGLSIAAGARYVRVKLVVTLGAGETLELYRVETTQNRGYVGELFVNSYIFFKNGAALVDAGTAYGLNISGTLDTGESGLVTHSSGAATGSSGHAYEVRSWSASEDAYAAFHVPGNFAAMFGLGAAAKDFVVGGWSMGAARYRVWSDYNRRSYVATVSVTVPAGSAGVAGAATVTFPAGRFSVKPVVIVTQASLPASSGLFIPKINSNGDSTFVDVYVYSSVALASSVTVSVNVLAFQSV